MCPQGAALGCHRAGPSGLTRAARFAPGPEGPIYGSPGQRPGYMAHGRCALKGRDNGWALKDEFIIETQRCCVAESPLLLADLRRPYRALCSCSNRPGRVIPLNLVHKRDSDSRGWLWQGRRTWHRPTLIVLLSPFVLGLLWGLPPEPEGFHVELYVEWTMLFLFVLPGLVTLWRVLARDIFIALFLPCVLLSLFIGLATSIYVEYLLRGTTYPID